jgi:hypothetical protein
VVVYQAVLPVSQLSVKLHKVCSISSYYFRLNCVPGEICARFKEYSSVCSVCSSVLRSSVSSGWPGIRSRCIHKTQGALFLVRSHVGTSMNCES